MKTGRTLLLTAGVLAGVGGLAGGLSSIIANDYVRHGYSYLALVELTRSLNRSLYLLGVEAVALTLLVVTLHHWARNALRWSGWIAGLTLLYLLVDRLKLDYRADWVWNELRLTNRLCVVLLALAAVALAARKHRLLERLAEASVRPAIGVLAAAGLLTLGESVWSGNLQRRLAGKPNIIIIVVDALRADHVSALGYERNTTPFIDSLAADGVIFTQAASNANATRSTVPSIFTQMFPSVHGMLGPDGQVLSSKFVTLAELLKNQGYATLAYMPNGPLKRIFHFNQGFDVYDDRIMGLGELERFDSALLINERLLAWTARNPNERFFLYIHYVEPHSPYYPPPGYDRMFYETAALKPVRRITGNEFDRMRRGSGKTYALEINDLNFYVAQYDAEIRYVDEQMRELFEELGRRGVLDNAAVFVTADHGEAFLEHGEWMHVSAPLYDEVIHVPLIAKLPGGEGKGLRLDAPVLTFDISATILDLLGLKPAFEVQAKSLLPIIRRQVERQWEFTFSESVDQTALRNPEWKYLRDRRSGTGRLYHLPEDPGEARDLVGQRPELARDFETKLQALTELNKKLAAGRRAGTRKLDEKTREQLKALGYVN